MLLFENYQVIFTHNYDDQHYTTGLLIRDYQNSFYLHNENKILFIGKQTNISYSEQFDHD